MVGVLLPRGIGRSALVQYPRTAKASLSCRAPPFVSVSFVLFALLRVAPRALACLRSAPPPRAGFLVLRLAPPGFTASPPADSARPRAGSGSTSSKPWGRGTLPAGESPTRETQGEVLIDHGRRRAAGLRASLAVRNPSPTGPAWGYGGSGPTQLALAILLAAIDEATAERFYQPFPWSVIAPIEADRWALDAGDVLGLARSRRPLGTDNVVHLAVDESCARRLLGDATHLPGGCTSTLFMRTDPGPVHPVYTDLGVRDSSLFMRGQTPVFTGVLWILGVRPGRAPTRR